MGYIELFALLVFAHLLLDYPLQADFMAKGKNHKKPIPGVPWFTLLISHSFMHAFAVYYITNNVLFFVLEWIFHTVIDHAKCAEVISFNTDQALHIALKVIMVFLTYSATTV